MTDQSQAHLVMMLCIPPSYRYLSCSLAHLDSYISYHISQYSYYYHLFHYLLIFYHYVYRERDV